ncbi:centromere protein F isoform X2 [Stegastes partitus]|uniref:Centromere protein F isoform X2 n=1 Tax=Stegastes partitus TaxID=144197 RepID=A0A9Y4NS39_9TELE|nr:PREDICTED: centromere protein F-like isoform X2 [Stegastes partitus]
MSWAEEDWTVGLPGRVLQKVKELQIHQERLSRENKQKQLQLDNINTSLEKQTVKYEEVRGELHSLQRELQNVREEAKVAVTGRERLTQEIQTKQAQVCSLEGQLDAARTLGNKLTQEIKRLEAELEKLQNSSRPTDITPFSTPCWNTTSPWENNGSRQEERSGQRDEGQNQASVRRLQFSDMPTASLPRQQHKSTPHRHPSDQSDIFSTPSAAFPWERDDSRPAARRRLPPSPQMPCPDVTNQGLSEQGSCGKEKDLKTETDISLSEMRRCISALEDELSAKAGTLKTFQNEMVLSKKELAAKELNLQKVRDELSQAHTRMAQDSERASGAEQKLKQLQEELKCQRQNAESSRLQHQQRTKELEKQHQRDLTELQKERQCLERQHQQEVNKLNQELQQARTLHNALQAQADKLSLQKQVLDKELDTTKEKLKWTEGELKESQKKETQTQAKLTEAVREAEGVAVSLEQSRKRERALEEEGKRRVEELADALRLIKELQEQNSAPAPPSQPVQFCPVGQSFSPQSSFPHHPRPATHSKRPASTRAEQRRQEEEDVDARGAEITASYPSDREPGEGIDSEHITDLVSPGSERLQRAGHRRISNEEDNRSRNEFSDCDMSGPSKSDSSHSVVSAPVNLSVDGDKVIDPEKTRSLKSEQTIPSEELKRENAMLRSELQDVREELQKRLEDLETQRRAETEARTRLKQLSRKHSSQTVEKEEKDKEWKAQLESEKAETERLRRTIGALEAEMKRVREEGDKKEREEQEEEKNQAQEDRESEMIELNMQLKKQLAEFKAQLALEREERKREEEERNQITNTDSDVKTELSIKLAELQAEVEELKRRGKEESQEEERLSVANSPLTYLTLHNDELNSNIVSCDRKLLPSPEQHLLFCQSTNQRNMLVSQATADIIQEEIKVIDAEHSPVSDDDQTGGVASDLKDTEHNYLGGSSPSDPQKGEVAVSDLAKEVAHLQGEYAKETERANQYQVKLEALQNQVTRQTQQLTMAFEKQSQHISGLLAELQEKESALLSQGEELLRCKQELDVLKTEKEEEIKMTVKEVAEEGQRQQKHDDKLELSETHSKQEQKCLIAPHDAADSLADDDLHLQKDVSQPQTRTCIAETPTLGSSEEDNEARGLGEHPDSVDLKMAPSNHDPACVMVENQSGHNGVTADMITQLLALRQENQLLKQRLEDLTITDTRSPTSQTDFENREDPVTQSHNTGDAAVSCLMEQKTNNVPNDVTTEEQQSLNVKKSEGEGHDLEREDKTTQAEEDLDEVSQAHINHLQQQVEALQMKVRALSAETQQKSEELAVWRLASQPAPTFDQLIPSTDDQCEIQEQVFAVRQSQSNLQPTDEMIKDQGQTVQEPMLGTQKNQGNITVVREDQLFLSCSSNKLQVRTLFSRLQNSNVVEPKSLHPSKKTAALQEYNQDTAKTDQESEKENQEINFLQQSDACSTQYKLKRDTELIQISSDKMAQQPVAKDAHKVSRPNPTKMECYTGRLDPKQNPSRATNEVYTVSNSADRGVKLEMKSVSSQTEESLCHRDVSTVCANTQTEVEEENEQELVDSPPVSPVPLAEGTREGEKVLFAGSFPIPADPARLAERIRRNRTQLSAAFDDTEYEPYGLPEVVMKGFADIPSGPSCPYIVRRGLLGTTVVPASPKDPGEEEDETD